MAALFSLRFWRECCDRLFPLFFAAIFTMLAVQRGISVLARGGEDHASRMHVIRLVAYLLILVAIMDKNRAERTTAGAAPVPPEGDSNPARHAWFLRGE